MRGPLSGTRAWLLQRLSALYLLGFLIFALATVLTRSTPWDYATWRAFVLSPGVTVAILVLFASLLLHAWVGVRDVILDYVHPSGARLALLGIVLTAELAVAAWVLVFLLGHS
jgi:succinate dehydrogenase / fumarate reductase membrane anchor subunit